MRFAISLLIAISAAGCGGGTVVQSVVAPKNAASVDPKTGPSTNESIVRVEEKKTVANEPIVLEPLTLKLSDPGIVGPAHGAEKGLRWSLADGTSLRLDRDNAFQPVHPGSAMLVADSTDGRRFVQPVEVQESDDIGFATDILPILTRHGCNSGGCHGRLDGQNGFKLSLFGYALQQDYLSITRDLGGRRVDKLDPENSLLLSKATGHVSHGGGQVLHASSPDAIRIARWIGQGAHKFRRTRQTFTNLRLSAEAIRRTEPGLVTMHAIAEYDDGTSRDVSAWSTWKTLDDRVAGVDAFGRVSVLEPGETAIVVRFGSKVRSARVIFAKESLPESEFAPLAGESFVDRLIVDHLKTLGVAPSEPADDATFLRRVTLDLVGRLPEPAEIRRFVKDTAPDKRSKLAESLFADADFVRHWSLKFGDLLSISTTRQGNAAPFYLLWLQERIAKDVPWDKMVTELLTARGTPATRQDAPAAYSLENADPVVAGQLAAQRFLGVRLRCAQCHDHPFDVWTQTQAHEFSAFFAKVRPSTPMPGDSMNRVRIAYFPEGKVVHPLTKFPVAPHYLVGDKPPLKPDTDPLPALAEWMTSPENPFFAKAFVNWLWSQFFATGLVDPVDDISASNPPSHPELLDALAKRFRELNHQVKPMIREIVTSRAYGLSSVSDDRNRLFARFNAYQAPRPLSAQQAADALAQATGVPNRYANKPTGTRAIEIQDPATPSSILETLGRCDRRESCVSGESTATTLRQSLMWIGSDTVDSKVGAVSGYVRQLLQLDPEPDEIVESLYLRTVSRFPTEKELAHWRGLIEESADRTEIVEDLFWALLNTREFQFNH